MQGKSRKRIFQPANKTHWRRRVAWFPGSGSGRTSDAAKAIYLANGHNGRSQEEIETFNQQRVTVDQAKAQVE